MGNRFATLTQYHSLILGHGVLAAITFLFIVPIAVLLARFYTRQPGTAVRYHAYLQVLAIGLTTVVFVLGFFAVGPPRNLTNPHHGIGVAIYVLILVQAVGGRLSRKLAGRRSFRMHIHRWFGRAIALLGIVQVPLGLTLYGSPKALFILYAIWTGFLLLLYFILDYRDYGRREWNRGGIGGTESSRVSDPESGDGGAMKWLGPLAVGAGALALLRGRKKDRDAERALSRSPSPADRSYRGREPTVISSRRGSESYYDEKQSERRRASGGSFLDKLIAAGAGLGAGALVSKMMNRRGGRYDDEYSAVATDTPSRARRYGPRSDFTRSEFTESEFTDFTEDLRGPPGRRDRQSAILPAPRPRAESRPPPRPMTPPGRSQAATSRLTSTVDASDYSSYVSPSRRPPTPRKSGVGGKGILAALGLGFLAKMAKDRRDRIEEEMLRDEEERRREEEEERRAGRRASRYTGDGYPSPSRRDSRRRPHRPRPPPSGVTTTATSMLSDESSVEPRGNTPYDPAPPGARPPAPSSKPATSTLPRPTTSLAEPGTGVIRVPASIPPAGTVSGVHSRFEVSEPVSMPPMPPDPHGILHQGSDSEAYNPSNNRRRMQEAEAAAAAAQASATALAAQEEEERRRRGERVREQTSQVPPVSVRVRVHDDPDRNITLRMLTDEEVRREQQRRRRNDSVSSHSGAEAMPATKRRYRRDSSSQRRTDAEAAAERRVEKEMEMENDQLPPLSPPNPAFAAGARRSQGKDSAYYSGQPGGPSGAVPAAGGTISNLGSPAGLASPGGSHATFTSGPITDTAADRRQRRRMERRGATMQATTADTS